MRLTYIFGGLGEFTYTLVHYGNPTIQTSYTGTYITKGDSLKVTIKEKVEQNGQNPAVKTPSNITLYDDKTTFMLDANTLALKYITYPADAPVLTEVKFHRQLPD